MWLRRRSGRKNEYEDPSLARVAEDVKSAPLSLYPSLFLNPHVGHRGTPISELPLGQDRPISHLGSSSCLPLTRQPPTPSSCTAARCWGLSSHVPSVHRACSTCLLLPRRGPRGMLFDPALLVGAKACWEGRRCHRLHLRQLMALG